LIRLRVVGLVAATLAACAATTAAGSPATGDWARFGGDSQLTNDVPVADAADFQTSAASQLQTRWTASLDGPVIASPLYAEGVAVGQRLVNVAYATTQNGSVYGVDAADGTVLWQRQLGTAASTCDEVQAGVTSSYGIASTGVIDRGRNVLYVIGATGLVYALDLSTGQTESGWPVQIVEDTSGEFVWGGLTLAGNRLYVPVASYCDEPGLDGLYASGRLVAVDLTSAAIVAAFDVVPGDHGLGGIWGFGGSSVDPNTGDLWVATGNSWVDDEGCGCIQQTAGYAEAVVQLGADLGVVAWNRPDSIPGTTEDADFGSTPLLFQPPGCPPLAAAYAKNGQIYVWRRDALAAGPIWTFHGGPDGLDDSFVGEPSYSSELNMLIVSDARAYGPDGGITHFDAVTGFAIGPGCSLPSAPTWTAPDVGQGPKAPALIVGQLVFVVGGLVPGVFALDAATGTLLWSHELGGPVFAPPAFGGDQVYVGDTRGGLVALGIGPTPPSPPPPPVKLTAGKVTFATPHAGKLFTVTMAVKSGGKAVSGLVACVGKVAGKTLLVTRHGTVKGRATCAWVVPVTSHGKRFTGSITETYERQKISRTISARVI